jgi:hypothetical protein
VNERIREPSPWQASVNPQQEARTMRRTFYALLAVIALAPLAASAAAAPAAALTLKAKPGAVTFNHDKHAAQKCQTCHGVGQPGKIGCIDIAAGGKVCPGAGGAEPTRKDFFHGACIDCHKKEAKGPAKCAECHKKA